MKTAIYILVYILLISLASATDDLYNMTALDNTNNFYEYALALNEISDYAIGYGILLIVFSVAFMVNMGNTGNIFGGLAAGSFIGMLSALILLPLGFITFLSFEYIVVIGSISLILSLWFARG